jgi:chemotaxis protein methyltransferase CheR
MPAEPPVSLARAAGLELGRFRDSHVEERIRRAIERERVESVGALARLLRTDPGARSRFRRSVAVSVSGPFRDPEQFALLEHELLPSLLASRHRIRIWSAGCADGSELYSIGVLLERSSALERSFLLGSDLLSENLAAARSGAGFGPSPSEPVRRRLRWEQRDLLRDGVPQGKWQLIVCRNVAIYFAPAAKEALHAMLAAALAPGGILLVGRSERVNDPRELRLEPCGPHAYRRVP